MGWTAKVELFDADVYVNMNTSELVIEIAMGNNPREIEHVEKHLETFETVWIVCPNKEVRDGLKQRLKENGLLSDSIVFPVFPEFNEDELPPR